MDARQLADLLQDCKQPSPPLQVCPIIITQRGIIASVQLFYWQLSGYCRAGPQAIQVTAITRFAVLWGATQGAWAWIATLYSCCQPGARMPRLHSHRRSVRGVCRVSRSGTAPHICLRAPRSKRAHRRLTRRGRLVWCIDNSTTLPAHPQAAISAPAVLLKQFQRAGLGDFLGAQQPQRGG